MSNFKEIKNYTENDIIYLSSKKNLEIDRRTIYITKNRKDKDQSSP